MSKILCIFPKDSTTEFLDPLFEELCKKYDATPLLGDPQDDDDYLDKLAEQAEQSDTIIFYPRRIGTLQFVYEIKPVVL